MIDVTTELVVGIAFGFIVGIAPAIAVGALAAGGRVRDSKLPLPAGVAIGVGLAALNGYVVGIVSPELVRTPLPRLGTGTLVVALLSVYATSQGERIAAELPLGSGRPTVRKRSLSAAAIDAVDAMGQVTIRTAGGVRDIDGYPPLSPDLRATIEADAWRLPADLPLSALETRLATRLRIDYDLTTVSVSIDERGRASVAAAPPTEGVVVPEGWRAVPVPALVPPGLEPGVDVDVYARDTSVTGTVLSVHGNDRVRERGVSGDSAGAGGAVTVAVPAADAAAILTTDRARIAVRASGGDADRTALARLERADYAVRHVSYGAITSMDEVPGDGTDDAIHVVAATSPDDTGATDSTSPEPVADRDRWRLDPERGGLEERDSVFVVGERVAVRRCIDDDRDSRPRPPVEESPEVSQ